MAIERTFSIIKPDGVEKGIIGKILSRFETKGLKPVAMRMQHLSQREAEGFGHHLRRGRGAEELAAAAGRAARAATHRRRLLRADHAVHEPGADRLHLARVLGIDRRTLLGKLQRHGIVERSAPAHTPIPWSDPPRDR